MRMLFSCVVYVLVLGCGQPTTTAGKAENSEAIQRRREISAIYEKWQNARKDQKAIEAAGQQNEHSGYPAAKLKEMDADEEAKKKFGVSAELLPQLLK